MLKLFLIYNNKYGILEIYFDRYIIIGSQQFSNKVSIVQFK